MIRYHGVLSSHAKARAEVVPRAEELPVQLPLFVRDKITDRDHDVLAPDPPRARGDLRRTPWRGRGPHLEEEASLQQARLHRTEHEVGELA